MITQPRPIALQTSIDNGVPVLVIDKKSPFGRQGHAPVADDVLGQTLQVLALIRQDAAAAVHIEAGMYPATQHLRDAEGEVVVRHREQDGLTEQCTEELDLLVCKNLSICQAVYPWHFE